MKVFTLENGNVGVGARVDSFTLKGAGVTIPAVVVGESGRGRALGILPVSLTSAQYAEWQEKGYVAITNATVGETKSGNPKLFASAEGSDVEKDDSKAIVVFRTAIGFRGGNDHLGDLDEEYYVFGDMTAISDMEAAGVPIQDEYTRAEVLKYSRMYVDFKWGVGDEAREDAGFEKAFRFKPFPGEILTEGMIAQGDAGRMGNGQQLIAVIPAGVVFRTGYFGRLYGAPRAHYYIFRDGEMLSATWQERQITDIF